METLTPALPENSAASPGDSDAAQPYPADASLATERIQAYCKALGMSDEDAVSRITRLILDRVTAQRPNDDGRAWMRISVDALIDEVGPWRDTLSQHIEREPHACGASLPAILHDRPDALLETDRLPQPEALCRGICARPTPPLPPSARCEMPRQRFGKPPAILRPGFWYRLWRAGQRDEHPIERMIRRRG